MQYFGFDRPSFGIKTFGFGANFDPMTLFAGGEQGVWYDPSDKSTLFQDVAGTVPVTKDGDPVALMRDKSGNGNHAVQTVSASRPTYQTDGILHWLQADGIDDYFDSINLVTWNGAAFFQSSAMAFTSVQSYGGIFRFLREGGSPDQNYFEEYANAGDANYKVAVQRYPSLMIITSMYARPNLGVNHVSWQSNGATAKTQVIPTQSTITDVGATTLASGNATLSLFRGTNGDYMGGRMYGFIWLSATPTDAERNNANAYLAQKSGVTL